MTEEELYNAWKSSIEKAIDYLDKNPWDKENNSTGYDVLSDGKYYPPKEVFKHAVDFFQKKYPKENNTASPIKGGIPTNAFLEKYGVTIEDKKTKINSITRKLNERYPRIWRCADSYKWDILKKYDLLTFDYLSEEVDYTNYDLTNISGKTSIKPWVNDLKKGDLIFVMDKYKFYGIAIAMSGYKFGSETIPMGNNGNKPAIPVYYLIKLDSGSQHLMNVHNNPGTFSSINNWSFTLPETLTFLDKKHPTYLNKLVSNQAVTNHNQSNRYNLNNVMNLNQILYGPPGTGKTYYTKELAVEIADPGFNTNHFENEDAKREALSERYNELIKNQQIVFTTFHQSFSYEDFIEGIKPEMENKNVIYNRIPGVFKELCEHSTLKSNSNFEEVLEKFKKDLIEKEKVIDTGKIKFDVYYEGGKTFKINPHDSKNDNPKYPASIENILKLYQDKADGNMYNPSYVKGILNHLYTDYGLTKYDSITDESVKNHVLIIDEINRGNISQIFGELITLLEEDKRLGNSESLEVTLPYSKEKFGVPPNLFIIGTMNTADRSVEALDTALRRRFAFTEIMPKPELLSEITYKDFNLETVLRTINERIEILLDRDHTIGHSYFIKLKNNDTDGLKSVFKNRIIPLLQEYFYHDYEKIAMILGEGFVTVKNENSAKVRFAKFSKTSLEFPDDIIQFELTSDIVDIEAAIKLLLNENA